MTEEKYTVSLTEDQVLLVNNLVCDECYKISKKVLVCEDLDQKDDLRKKGTVLWN